VSQLYNGIIGFVDAINKSENRRIMMSLLVEEQTEGKKEYKYYDTRCGDTWNCLNDADEVNYEQ
jgi:hypothetical protein